MGKDPESEQGIKKNLKGFGRALLKPRKIKKSKSSNRMNNLLKWGFPRIKERKRKTPT